MDLSDRRRYFNLCDPSEPLSPDDARSVDLDRWGEGTSRAGRLFDSLVQEFELSTGPLYKLFTGSPGSGKSTALRRLAERLADPQGLQLLPVIVDSEEQLDLHEPLDGLELMLTIVHAIERALLEREGRAEAAMSEGSLARLLTWLTRIDGELARSPAAIAELRARPISSARARSIVDSKRDEFLRELGHELRELDRRARALTSGGLIVLVDSLEKLSGTATSWAEVMDSAERLFQRGSPWLDLPIHVVYTVPPALMTRVADIALMPMIKVRDRDGRPFEAGIAAARSLIEARIDPGDLPELLGDQWEARLSKLIAWSGGSPRELVRLLRSCLRYKIHPLSEQDFERLFDELVANYQTLIYREDYPWLTEVARTRWLEVETQAHRARADRLLGLNAALYYANGVGFYDLHPALYPILALDQGSDRAQLEPAPDGAPSSPQVSALHRLALRDIGPISALDVEFAPRINLVLGDNGLGKTFVLDVGWWALTGSWPHRAAWPSSRERLRQPQIELHTLAGDAAVSRFDLRREVWPRGPTWPAMTSPVLYARVDGGVSIWDPSRHDLYGLGDPRSVPALHLLAGQLEDGLRDPRDGTSRCNGLLEDWENWRHNDPELFEVFFTIVRELFEGDSDSAASEAPRPGPTIQLSKTDERLIPTLEFPYGTVPVTYLSAGMRRILGLAYALVWTHSGHRRATLAEGGLAEGGLAEGRAPAGHTVLMVDELESHLHPRWQRLLLPALVKAMTLLDADARVQLLATSHSPLALASLAELFDPTRDRIWQLEIANHKVWLDELAWSNQGEVNGWLTSPFFGLSKAASLPAQRAVEAARALLRGAPSPHPALATKAAIEAELSAREKKLRDDLLAARA